VLKIIRGSRILFLATSAAGLALRLVFIFRFPSVTTDSYIYGDIAKNWLQHGVYGITSGLGIAPTYIRLPGYPAFLAAIFAIFGMEHYRAVLIVQMFVDLGTCFLIADLARRVAGPRAAKAAFILAALCPFTSNYAAAALTETLEVFFTALALNFAVTGLQTGQTRRVLPWIGCGIAIAAAMLLRPDGGILLAAIELFLLGTLLRARFNKSSVSYISRAFLIIALISIAPLIPWTLRNLRTIHRFQPLAPRYANEENEFVPAGFNRWTKTWIADYASVEEIYWMVPGSPIDVDKLPHRAFDSAQQYDETSEIFENYNSVLHINPELDAKFSALAGQRVDHSLLRYYGWLPALRIADMWLRPRTEMLPSDSRWWEFDDDPKWSALAVALGAIGLLYVGTGVGGLTRIAEVKNAGLLVAFVVLRSLFLGTVESPEPRYTLECFPVLIVFASVLLQKKAAANYLSPDLS